MAGDAVLVGKLVIVVGGAIIVSHTILRLAVLVQRPGVDGAPDVQVHDTSPTSPRTSVRPGDLRLDFFKFPESLQNE